MKNVLESRTTAAQSLNTKTNKTQYYPVLTTVCSGTGRLPQSSPQKEKTKKRQKRNKMKRKRSKQHNGRGEVRLIRDRTGGEPLTRHTANPALLRGRPTAPKMTTQTQQQHRKNKQITRAISCSHHAATTEIEPRLA